jgi:hypothetical protein
MASVELPAGDSRAISIRAIHYQPEASGHIDR